MSDVSVLREVAPSARVAPDARIGPFCVVGPGVTIGPGTVLVRRVSVTGDTSIGSDNVFEEGCVLGTAPQDLKYAGRPTRLLIGHRNHFGRGVTVHVGTEAGGYLTSIGNDNVLGAGCHVAHDCYVDDHTHLEDNVMLAGHVRVQTGAVLGAMCGVHHFVTIGRYARVGPRTPVRRDVPPYTDFAADGPSSPPAVRGIHEDGIARAALAGDEEKDLRRAMRELFEDEFAVQTKIEQLFSMGVEGEVADLCTFCRQSLQGVYGRHRELFRGGLPPEVHEYLSSEEIAKIQRSFP